MPFPRGDQVVVLHAFVGLGKTQYKPNNVGPGLKVISRVSKGMAFVHVNDDVPCEFQAHLLIESIYAPKTLNRLGAHRWGHNLWLIRYAQVTLPMGSVIPPSMKAIIGMTTSHSFLSVTIRSRAQYRRATPYRVWYLALKSSIPAGESTRCLNLPI